MSHISFFHNRKASCSGCYGCKHCPHSRGIEEAADGLQTAAKGDGNGLQTAAKGDGNGLQTATAGDGNGLQTADKGCADGLPLDQLPVGASASICKVAGQGALRRRLLDMGLTPGTAVTIQKRAPMGDPIEIHLRSYELSLRVDEARQITVHTAVSAAPKATNSKAAPKTANGQAAHKAFPGGTDADPAKEAVK